MVVNSLDAAAASAALPHPRRQDGSRNPRRPGHPDLLEEIAAHIDRLRRADQPTDSDAYLFPNRKDDA